MGAVSGWVRGLLTGLLAVHALSASAASARERVAVLGLSSEDGHDTSRRLSSALRSEAGAVDGWEVLEARPLLTQMTMANDCDIGEAECRMRIGQALSADRVVYGTTSRAPVGGTVHVALTMYTTRDGAIVGMTEREIPLETAGGKGLADHARALLDELRGLDAGRVTEEAADQPAAPEATAPGPPPAAEEHDVLNEMPTAEALGESPSTKRLIGYGLLGTAGLSAGLAVFSWTQIEAAADDETFEMYRREVGRAQPSVSDVCDEADDGESYGLSDTALSRVQDRCDSGRTFELLQYVFMGAAVASGGVGLYLVLDDDETAGAPSSLAVSPRLDLRRPGVTATLRF